MQDQQQRNKIRVGIVGATGYTGAELLRVLHFHPCVDVQNVYSRSHVGKLLHEVHPALEGVFHGVFQGIDDVGKDEVDCLYFALPHTRSAEQIEKIYKILPTTKFIDLAADFRIPPCLFEEVYKVSHPAKTLYDKAVYGAPELIDSSDFEHKRIVANPGCFAYCMLLSLAPFLTVYGSQEPLHVYVSGITGSSGSGATPSKGTHHPERNDSMKAYNPLVHRHVPEVQHQLHQITGKEIKIHFVPQSGPYTRGIFMTSFLPQLSDVKSVETVYSDYYKESHFVRLRNRSPQLSEVRGSNFCDMWIKPGDETVVIMSAIDNLMKGAAGNAVQCMNLLFGLEPKQGLLMGPLLP